MSRAASPARAALLDALTAGFCGTYDAFAELAGVQPSTARATLKELSRTGHACARRRERRSDRSAGAAPAVYAAPQPSFDSLGFALRVWR